MSNCTDLCRLSTFSHRVEFGDNDDTDGLVKPRAHAQPLLVGAPVQAGDWLSGQRDVLQEVDGAGDAHVCAVRVLLASLSGILAGNDKYTSINIQA